MDLKLSKNKRFLEIIKYDSLDELEQIQHSLTKKVKNYRFLPQVRNGSWDGSISFFDETNNRIPSGLWKFTFDTLKKYGYKCNLYGIKDLFNQEISYDEFKEYSLNLMKDHEITPRDYQIKASYNIIKYRRCGSLMSTSSGKTLMTFLTIAYGLEKGLMKNILMIVPNVSLVVQGANDFYDYNHFAKIPIVIQQVFHGKERAVGENVTIGTYQSLVKFDKEYFKKFDTVIIDEFHKTTATSISKIMNKLWHCTYRFGLSGTLPNEKTADYLTIVSQTGPVINDVNADSLIQDGFITPVKIHVLRMDYLDKETKEAFHNLSKKLDATELYQQEKKFVISHKKRLKYVTNIISNSKNNSLVLFHLIEHGKALFKELKKHNKHVYYIDGSTKADNRELYKKVMEKGNTAIYYTFEFDGNEVKFEENKSILLSNGKYKKAKNIKEGDDIADSFLQNYKN